MLECDTENEVNGIQIINVIISLKCSEKIQVICLFDSFFYGMIKGFGMDSPSHSLTSVMLQSGQEQSTSS